MSQFPHDEFVKEYLPELIKDYGVAKSAENITAQRREIDVFFQPMKQVPMTPNTLGLLGRLAQRTCLFEIYRNPVKTHQINECLGKLFDVQTSIRRDLRKSQEKISISQETAKLWILTPTLSEQILDSFEAKFRENWLEGIYFLPVALATGIVVIHQLPISEETLWLRLLGKGKVQENAIDELKALPKEHPHRDNVELIGNLFAMLELNKNKAKPLTKEDEELIMKLSPIYKARLEEREQIGLQKGIQQGIKQEAMLIVRLLKRKIGNIPSNLENTVMNLSLSTLEDLGEALLDFDSLDNLIDWLDHASHGTSCTG